MADGIKAGAIPDQLEADVLRLAGEGWTTRKLATWLTEQGWPVGHVTVSRWLKEHRQERAEVTRDVVREKLGKTVATDIEVLGEHVKLCNEQARRALADGEQRLAISWLEQCRKTIDTRLHYSGADTPDGTGSLADFLSRSFGEEGPGEVED